MSVSNAMNRFFDSSRFAVVGASKDPSKFGNKVRLTRFSLIHSSGL